MSAEISYSRVEPGTSVPFGHGEPFNLFPSTRPESITLDVDAEGRITIAPDATADELRAALTIATASFVRLRRHAEDLECAPLVLITRRIAYAKALVDAQVCDAAEADRRALRAYPSPAEENRA